jgi:hypothetical protein
MRRNSFNLLVTVLAGVGLLALAGCSSGGDAKALRPVPSTVATTTTAAPSATVGPVLVDGIPQVTASPSRASVGTRVRLEGTGFTDDMWKARGATLWLAERAGCNLYAAAAHSVTVSPAGRLAGEFTVPATGACRMSSTGERLVTAGSYRIVFACTACAIGELEVTTTTAGEAVVDSGTRAGGAWQLVAEPGGGSGLVCAFLRGPFDAGGRVCNEASEQDANGNDTLRYSGAGDGRFIVGVSQPPVSRVRVELRDGSVVERATVAAPFTTAARFVALPLPSDSAVRSLTALDSGGTVLTRIVVNP